MVAWCCCSHPWNCNITWKELHTVNHKPNKFSSYFSTPTEAQEPELREYFEAPGHGPSIK